MDYSSFIAEISKVLRTSRVEVERLIITAPHRYKSYRVDKRNGGKREIHHPTPALKAVQRWLVDTVLSQMPIHESVYSYRKGRSIAMHAAVHLESNYIVRMDFKDFFPSLSAKEVGDYIRRLNVVRHLGMDELTISALVKILCRYNKLKGRLELSIGAPSSPAVSNALLYNFDDAMARKAAELNCLYTRYADDLYLSGRCKPAVAELQGYLRRSAAFKLPFLVFNEDKTQHLSRKRRVSVTGVTITSDRRLSIGRDLKRKLKTRVHLALQGGLGMEELSSLRGMLAHVKSVEPSFYNSLALKFGGYELASIMTEELVRTD